MDPYLLANQSFDNNGKWDTRKKCKNYIEYICSVELFHCLPLWKTVLFVSSRAFSLSTPTFSLSTPVDNSEAKWKKATKCNKDYFVMREWNIL